MTEKKIYDDASHVESRPGAVDVSGPDHVAVSMTPEAAIVTGGKLIDKAAEAMGKAAINADADRHGLTPPFAP